MKKTLKFIMLSIFTITLGLSLFACGGSTKTTINISGSTSITPLMTKLAAKYEESHTDIQIVITGNGSSTGIADTDTNKNDIGMSSRNLKDDEKAKVTDQKIADDGIVLIANKNSTVTNVTSEQIYELYANGTEISGGLKNGISREAGSGTRDAFDSLIKNSDGAELSKVAKFSAKISEQSSTGAVKTEITSNSAGDKIGYISLGSVDNTIKTLQFGGIEPTSTNVKNGTYKLARPFIIVTKKDKTLSDEVQSFIDFIFSSEGQAIVSANGYISV